MLTIAAIMTVVTPTCVVLPVDAAHFPVPTCLAHLDVHSTQLKPSHQCRFLHRSAPFPLTPPLQMISLMDNLLKRENLDLHLTPYKVLPTGGRAGGTGVTMAEYLLHLECAWEAHSVLCM